MIQLYTILQVLPQSLRIIQMKILKVKRSNNSTSFVTNQDLLECIRSNKSFVATRENSNRMLSNHSKVSLLKRKDYDRMLTQENDSLVVNAPSEFTPPPADRAIVLLQDCLADIADSSPKLTHKIRKAIAYVREVKEEESRKEQNMKEMEREVEKALLQKLEKSCQEKAILKMQNEELKAKLVQYRQRLSLLKKEGKMGQVCSKTGSNSALEELIINQSQLIDRQCEQSKRESEQFRRMLQVQARTIEQMLMKQPNKINRQIETARFPTQAREIKGRPPSTLRF